MQITPFPHLFALTIIHTLSIIQYYWQWFLTFIMKSIENLSKHFVYLKQNGTRKIHQSILKGYLSVLSYPNKLLVIRWHRISLKVFNMHWWAPKYNRGNRDLNWILRIFIEIYIHLMFGLENMHLTLTIDWMKSSFINYQSLLTAIEQKLNNFRWKMKLTKYIW